MTIGSIHELDTPVGRLLIAADDSGLTHVEAEHASRMPAALPALTALARSHVEAASSALDEYFRGERKQFDDLELSAGGSEFQLRVWRALYAIPSGRTESYGELAARIGKPGAARAVGMANNRNPLAIIVPCHRVIGASGKLVGYGGGLDMKRWLLEHEGVRYARVDSRSCSTKAPPTQEPTGIAM